MIKGDDFGSGTKNNANVIECARCNESFIIWLRQYARSDWLLSGHYFLAMTGFYEFFSTMAQRLF